MNKKIISFAAAIALSVTAAALHTYAEDTAAVSSNAIDISENFDTASPTGKVVYTGDSKDYTWNILATQDFGYATSNAYVAIPAANKTAVSLTQNSDNNGTANTILTIPNGAGGVDKDIDITFDAGVCYGFSQAAKTWELIFSSSDGTEMFSLQLRNGGDAIAAALAVGDNVQSTDYAFTAKEFTKVSATVSFNEGGGGYVTFGSVSADFEGGSDIAQIAVRSMSNSDYNRPFVIDNFTMKTYDKKQLSFRVTSTGEGQSVKGAELTVDSHTYKLGGDGVLEKYFRQDTTYNYKVRLANHEQASGSFKAYKPEEYTDRYIFKNIDARRPTLIHAYYDDETNALDSVTSTPVPVSNNTYTVTGERRKGYTEKYFLWNSLKGIKPYATAEVKKGASETIDVTLNYHDTVSPARIELAGGDEYIYIPEEGYADTSAITTTVYDDLGFVMKDAVIDWSLTEGASETIGVMNGAVTIGSGYTFTGDTHTVKIRATVRGAENVYAEKNLTVRKLSDINDFEVAGPVVIKNGTMAEYTVTKVTDRYGKESDEIPDSFTLTAANSASAALMDSEADINGLTITPDINLNGSHEKDIKITIALNSAGNIKKTITAKVYDYDFYEPGVGTASYGSPRMETVNGAVSIVWPATQNGGRTTEIPLPKPVELTPGSCKVITFNNFAVKDTVSSNERSLRFTNSDGIDVVNIDFNSITDNRAHYVNVLNNWGSANEQSIGRFALNSVASAEITLKTDAQGVTSVIFKYNGTTTITTVIDEPIGSVHDIAEIRLRGSTGAPDERMLSLTNIKITDGVLNDVEIIGSDKIAVVHGADASKQFGVKVFSTDSTESFTWSVAGKDGSPIDGVGIDQDGVLTVSDTDSVKALIAELEKETDDKEKYNAVIKYSDKNHIGEKKISIVDYASVSSFELNGPEYLEAGKADKVSYSISNIIDNYGNEADMQKAYMITTGEDIAKIDMSTGEVTLTPNKTGTFTVTAAVGNPGQTKVVDLPVTVAKYSKTGDTDGAASVAVDVTELANYSETTEYLVTTADADKKLVNQTIETAQNGVVTVDTTGAAKYEVSPIYSYTNVGNVAAGKTIPICDGTYDFTFKKSNSTRADIFVNGAMVGQNVDQVSIQRTLSGGSEYTARDIKVEGGKAVVTMKDNTSEMDSITVSKTPSILNRKTHVYVLGDSLASSYYGVYDTVDENGKPLPGTGQTGWGETLGEFLTDDMIVTNLAESGSAAAALYATTFPGIIQNAEEGDYLIMECGYQDEPNSTLQMMEAAVMNIHKACEEKGVELILVTPNCAAHGTANIAAITGSETGGVRFGPELMELAGKLNILGIDLSGVNGIELPMLIEYGEDYWLRNFNLVRPEDGAAVDRLHSSYWGAVLHAANIATAIDEAQKSEDNPVLAERLAGLKLYDEAELVMTGTDGNTKKFKIGWYTEINQDIENPDENPDSNTENE